MSDDDLTKAVAEKVMGWHAYQCESAYFDSWCNKDGEGEGPVGNWKPLRDWSQTFDVVQAMREKGWSLMLVTFLTSEDTRAVFQIHGPALAEATNINGRRAILEAALAATSSGSVPTTAEGGE